MRRRCLWPPAAACTCAPTRSPPGDGYRFAGWLNAAGERVDLLPASAFFAKTADGETDWRTTVSVTLTAEWEKA